MNRFSFLCMERGYCKCRNEHTGCDGSDLFIIRYISAVIKAFAEDQRCEVKTCQFPVTNSQLYFIMFPPNSTDLY